MCWTGRFIGPGVINIVLGVQNITCHRLKFLGKSREQLGVGHHQGEAWHQDLKTVKFVHGILRKIRRLQWDIMENLKVMQLKSNRFLSDYQQKVNLIGCQV